MSKATCAMCGTDITVPKGTVVPDDCDVVCGDCGAEIMAYQEEQATKAEYEATLH